MKKLKDILVALVVAPILTFYSLKDMLYWSWGKK